jgi:hypothetical protein
MLYNKITHIQNTAHLSLVVVEGKADIGDMVVLTLGNELGSRLGVVGEGVDILTLDGFLKARDLILSRNDFGEAGACDSECPVVLVSTVGLTENVEVSVCCEAYVGAGGVGKEGGRFGTIFSKLVVRMGIESFRGGCIIATFS